MVEESLPLVTRRKKVKKFYPEIISVHRLSTVHRTYREKERTLAIKTVLSAKIFQILR